MRSDWRMMKREVTKKMKLDKIREKIADGSLGKSIRQGSLKDGIYQHVIEHPDEVFTSKEIELLFKEAKAPTVRGTIQNICTDGLLMRTKLNGVYVYGVEHAISELIGIVNGE